jgi:hypothetical protein
MDEYKPIDKFDRAVGGLLAGNNLHTKPTTFEEVEPYTGEAETFIVQTIRDENGDHVVVKFMDKDGNKRMILPPKVVSTIVRQRDALTARARSNSSKARMKERMLAGWKPIPPTKRKKSRSEPHKVSDETLPEGTDYRQHQMKS